MRDGRVVLSAVVAMSLAVLPIARSVRADPPAAGGATSASSAPKKKAPPAKAPHGKAAKPPATKEAAAPKTTSPAGAAADSKAHAHTAPSSTHEVVEHESRIEFDERMVRGQSAAGAIFLFQRTPSELKSIVEIPDSFRPKTVELLQNRGAP
jgi:hypothetical protein